MVRRLIFEKNFWPLAVGACYGALDCTYRKCEGTAALTGCRVPDES
jgi:hypothetical protein